MKVLARVREQRDGVLAAGRAIKVVAVSILAGFVRSSNYPGYLAGKTECKTRNLDGSRGKTRFSESCSQLW